MSFGIMARNFIKKLSVSNSLYATLVLLAVVAPFLAVRTMGNQSPIARILESQVTVNFVIALGMWGYFTEWYTNKKNWNRRKGMIFWIISTAFVFLALRLLGMETIFG